MRGVVLLLLFFFNSAFALFQRNYACPALSLNHGYVRMRQRARFARFSCENGYLLSGEKYAACIRGQWEKPLPKCVRPTCTKMRTSPNLYVHSSLRGAVMHFSCKPEYALRGATISHCDGWKWDANPPVCQKIGIKPQYFCDFETEEICGWSHDVTHDFDWRRFRYNTPSGHVGTGPSFDHTKGEGKDGHYMYLESSSRFENDTARLVSPFFDKTESNICFEFFYHMYGATMGTLRVYLKKANDSWVFEPKMAFFTKTGNQGDQWYKSITNLGPINQDYQIVIEGVRGSGYVSDIAIDDVRIIENCTPEMLTTEAEITITESVTTEVTFPLIESCENRCGLFGVTPTDTIYRIVCDCDTDCVDRNTCCLDYIAYCVLSGTDATTTTIIITEEETTTTTETTPIITKPISLILNTNATTVNRILSTVTTDDTQQENNEIVTIIRTAVVTTTKTPEDFNEISHQPADDVTITLMKKVDEELKQELSPPTDVLKTNMVTERIVKQTVSVKTIWIVVGVLIATVTLLLLAVVFVKMRNSYLFFNNMHSSSQSDVRFLASDEALDFTLAYTDM